MKKTRTLTKSVARKAFFFAIFLFAAVLASFGQNTQYGVGALQNNISGVENSAFGYNTLFNNFYGDGNVAVGHEALYKGITQGPPDASYNVAVGVRALRYNSEGYSNSALGYEALKSNSHGSNNVAIGYRALYTNADGRYNVACGYGALYSNQVSTGNVAIGHDALHDNLNEFNTAVGYSALSQNTMGATNTAMGFYALTNNTTGNNNVGIGSTSLSANTTGSNNAAFGVGALSANNTGNFNTANGNYALQNNTTGRNNTANGNFSLSFNTTGSYNQASGNYTLRNNTTGNYNTANGSFALYSNTTGRLNTGIGYAAGFTSPNNISNATSLGYFANATASNRVRIGNTNVTSIGGQVSWSTLSDGRFKKNIKDNVPGIEFIQQLHPVSYTIDNKTYEKHSGFSLKGTGMDETAIAEWEKQQTANESIVYIGFIAQEVEEVIKKEKYNFSGIVAPENEKDHYSIRYAEFVVPLVKATQQQQVELATLKSDIQELKNENAELKQLVMNLLDNKSVNMEGTNIDSPVKCFPNPNKGVIYLEIENTKQESSEIQVFNMSGNLIYSKKATSKQEIDLSAQPNGSYIIKTKIGSKIFQNKVLLQK